MAENFGWIEMVVFGTIALGFGVWQLTSINREIARDKAAKNEAAKSKSANDTTSD